MPHVTGCSAAWLAHLLWEQGVVGSNPTIPTKELKSGGEVRRIFNWESIGESIANQWEERGANG